MFFSKNNGGYYSYILIELRDALRIDFVIFINRIEIHLHY